jgi:hypothetical protein
LGVGTDERGPWNDVGRWNFVAEPEESLKSKVEGLNPGGKPSRTAK